MDERIRRRGRRTSRLEAMACPEGASPHLAKCCAERDACATICGITEEACTKAFDECYVRECEEVDDFDEHEQCLKDGKIGSRLALARRVCLARRGAEEGVYVSRSEGRRGAAAADPGAYL